MLAIALVLNVIYLVLMVAALRHVLPERKARQSQWLLAFTLWWPIYGDLYDKSIRSRRLRAVVFLTLMVTVVCYVAAFRTG
jgi:hypothetical protein